MTPPWLRSPRAAYSRIARTWFEQTHPRAPWLAPRAVKLLDAMASKDMLALEWGAGRSTVWLAERVEKVTSVEHDSGWVQRVRDRLAAQKLANVDLRHVAEPTDTPSISA